ncbi:M48 family metalloprotease [Bradyrhizobium sp. MOS002]|jgi:predicted Zn-dependent protease|uniref:M48 family metalloprotease n=1 Tax=Bradyrhizobium sp. MOS002 TaxID=2133947 RepID=UPI000D137A06|nr:M48 family metalloprotease [Bradyrhizobium sp. MOS002]PSO31516.1 peptidase [Bradyrhizobium sp. MOS002]
MLFQIALRKKSTALTSLVAAAAIALTPFSAAHAQAKGPPVLRDTETEQLLREYTRPILRAAGLEKQNIQMVIVNEGSFNAFVADGRRIFVNYGAILQSETPNQIIGVLAHETGHLAGGHLSKLREQLANAQTQMIIAMLLGAGAMAVGSTRGSGSAGNNGLANAGAAALAGPQEMIRRTLLSYQRQQEENADRAGVKFLTATQQSPKGMYETFKRFTSESLFAARGADPYLQSHPMPAERVASLQEFASSSPYWDKKDDAALQLRHDMVRAKISAFMERPETVYRRYPLTNDSMPARYARAISTYLHGDLRSALTQIDALIQVQPNNAYFYEVRGQALLEGGKPAEAIPALRKAVQLSNNAPLIEMLLGQALVGSDNKAYTDDAVRILRAAVAREPEAILGYMQLAMAYGRKGDYAEADLASAQAAYLRGDNKTARELATRAKTRFAVGTPGWVKADDIVASKPSRN